MNDTPAAVNDKLLEMMKKKTNMERFLMGFSMFETAKIIVASAISARDPEISSRELRKKLFLRFYGTEFSKDEIEKIFNKM